MDGDVADGSYERDISASIALTRDSGGRLGAQRPCASTISLRPVEGDGEFWESLGRSPHTAVAFSPDGSRLAGAFNAIVHIWPIGAAEPSVMLRGYVNSVTEIVYSYDGTFVASGSTQGDFRIWDVARAS